MCNALRRYALYALRFLKTLLGGNLADLNITERNRKIWKIVQSCDAGAIAHLEAFAAVLHGARLRYALVGTERIVTSLAVKEGNQVLLVTPEKALEELLDRILNAGIECTQMSSAARSAVKLSVDKLRLEQSRRNAVQSDPPAPALTSAGKLVIEVTNATHPPPSGEVSLAITWNELRGTLRDTYSDPGAEFKVLTSGPPPDEVLIDGPGVFEKWKADAVAKTAPTAVPTMQILCVYVLRNIKSVLTMHRPRCAVVGSLLRLTRASSRPPSLDTIARLPLSLSLALYLSLSPSRLRAAASST